MPCQKCINQLHTGSTSYSLHPSVVAEGWLTGCWLYPAKNWTWVLRWVVAMQYRASQACRWACSIRRTKSCELPLQARPSMFGNIAKSLVILIKGKDLQRMNPQGFQAVQSHLMPQSPALWVGWQWGTARLPRKRRLMVEKVAPGFSWPWR